MTPSQFTYLKDYVDQKQNSTAEVHCILSSMMCDFRLAALFLLTVTNMISCYWRTPSRALPYWRLDAKYPYLLPSSMLYGLQSSEAEHPHQLFSVWWFMGDRRVSSSLLVVLEQQRWCIGGLPQGPSEPGVQRISGGRTSPYWWYSRLFRWRCAWCMVSNQ